jgi:hypothetical protein
MYICISVLMNYDCATRPIIMPFISIITKFFSKHWLKGYLAQRWMAITVSILQKNFLTKCRPWATKKCQMFTYSSLGPARGLMCTLIYHWKFPMGKCMTFQGRCKNFQGRCKTISGEVRTSPHLPSKSGHANSALTRTVRDRLGLRLGLLELG